MFQLSAEVTHYVVPSKEPAAYLQAKVTLPLQAPWIQLFLQLIKGCIFNDGQAHDDTVGENANLIYDNPTYWM